MATYDIESSETGKVYEVQVPDNTNPQDVQTYVAGVEQESLEREKQGLPPNRYHTPPEASIDHLVNNPEYSAIPSHDIYKDHLVDNRYFSQDYSSIPPTAWEKFKFGIAASTTDVENLSTILISEYPILGHRLTFADGRWGTQVLSPEEQWGEDFYRLSPGLRKDRIHQVKQDQLRETYPEIYANGNQEAGMVVFGKGVGTMMTPTILTPVGKTYKVAAGVGALLGAEYAYLDQVSHNEELDLGEIGFYAGAGVLGGVGGKYLGDVASNTIQKIRLARLQASPQGVAEAHARTLEVNKVIEQAMGEGVNPIELERVVTERIGRSTEQILRDSHVGDLPLIRPTDTEVKFFSGMPDEGFTPVFRAVNAFADNFVGSLSTAVGRISPKLELRLRELDSTALRTVFERQKEITDFGNFWGGASWLKPVRAVTSAFRTTLSNEDRELAKYYLINGNLKDAEKIFARYGQDKVELFRRALRLNEDIFKDLQASGVRDIGHRANYWPRSVRDYEGLLAALPAKMRDAFTRMQDRYVARLKKSGDLAEDGILTTAQKEDLLNSFLRGETRLGIRDKPLSAGKERKLRHIPLELLDFYEDPLVAMMGYIDEATHVAARKRFFSSVIGEDPAAANARWYRRDTPETEQSIGRLVRKLQDEGELTAPQLIELADLLRVRFINGEVAMGGISQAFRQAGYMATLANPISAITQLGDLGNSLYRHGFIHTVGSMFDIPLDEAAITMRQLGLDRVIAEEFRNERVLAQSLHNLFTVSGFRLVDRLGKDVFIQGAYRKFTTAALKPNSRARKAMDARYKEAFGEEYDALLGDLSNGTVSERVKLLLWSELADVQPVSLSEMPVGYLDNPGMPRLLYMLKTYTAKQLDLMSRDMRDEWQKGNKLKAGKNAFTYALIVPTMNAGVQGVKDFMLGKEVSIEDFPDEYVEHFFKLFGTSEYALSGFAEEGHLGRLAADTLAPPVDWIVDSFQQFWEGATGGEPDWDLVMKHVPVVGRLYYNFFGPGLEEYRDKMWEENQFKNYPRVDTTEQPTLGGFK